MNLLIIEAIKNRKALAFRYHGLNRVVEPHAYGRDKAGDEIIRSYQISGGSDSGESIGWKIFKVREALSIVLLNNDFFTIRIDYQKNDSIMTTIFEQI